MNVKRWLYLVAGFTLLFMVVSFIKDLVGIANPLAAYGIPLLSGVIAAPLWVFVIRKYLLKRE